MREIERRLSRGLQELRSGWTTLRNRVSHLIGRKPEEDQGALIEKWRNLHKTIIPYEAGEYPDGTRYLAGRTLYFHNGSVREPEQVMDTFETPWCQATVDAMFGQRTTKQTVLERGFGLGIMSDFIYEKMKNNGGKHVIVELNKEIFKDLETWADGKMTDAQKNKKAIQIVIRTEAGEETRKFVPTGMTEADMLELVLINGDADEAISTFDPGYFSLIFSDTHQLRPEERGINDLLRVDLIKSRLKFDGRFTFCAFHRDSQEGDIDRNQYNRITPHFRYKVDTVVAIPPKHCSYFKYPRTRLPVVICEHPREAYGGTPLAMAA